MHTRAQYLSLYAVLVRTQLKALSQYRADFLIGVIGSAVLQMATILFLWAIMRRVPSMHGWTLDELLLLVGLMMVSRALCHMFAENLWTLGRDYVRTGDFDRLLVRPIDPLFHLLANRFCTEGLGTLVVGSIVLIHALDASAVAWTPANAVILPVVILSGGVIFFALNLIAAVTAFWVIDPIPVIGSIFFTHELGKYPLSIYRKPVRFVVTWLVPYGLISYYPGAVLLGRGTGWMVLLCPIMALVLLGVALAWWRVGLRHYGSTGS